MRGLMSMRVELSPESSKETQYPTAEQIAEAFTAIGFRPPSLLAQPRMPTEDKPATSERGLFRKLAGVVTSIVEEEASEAQEDVLRPATPFRAGVPAPSFAELAKEHLNSEDRDKTKLLSLASYALPVLMRMPARNAEDRERRRLAAESLVYASVVTPTRSQFVVSSENQSAVTIRLHNQLIESLQQGCEDLLTRLSRPIPIKGGTLRFTLQGRIEIYEVGQEDSTISGRLVGFRLRERLRFLAQTQQASVLVALLLFVVFVGLFVSLLLYHGQHISTIIPIHGSPGSQYIVQSDQFWLGQAERLQSGVLPVLLVTLITLVVKYPRGETVRWSQLLRPDSKSSA